MEQLKPASEFIAFAPPEVDAVILKRYNKDNAFSAIIDMALFSMNDLVMQQNGDTISLPIRPGSFS